MGVEKGVAERRRRAAELYEQGLSANRVAAIVGCDRKTVASDLRALGIEVRGRDKPDEERRQRVRELYPELRSIPKVAELLGCSTTSVCNDLKVLGIPRMDHHESLALAAAEIQRQLEERRGRVAELYPRLGSGYKVAAELGCSHGTVVNDLKVLGLSPGRRPKQRGRFVSCRRCGKEGLWRYHCELIDGEYGEFCKLGCWNKYRWEHGIALNTDALVSLSPHIVTGRTRQRYLGRWSGSKGAAAGIEAGRAKGGRPPKMTPEQQQEILRLDGEGKSMREIAEVVFGDRRLHLRVYRFLNR